MGTVVSVAIRYRTTIIIIAIIVTIIIVSTIVTIIISSGSSSSVSIICVTITTWRSGTARPRAPTGSSGWIRTAG